MISFCIWSEMSAYIVVLPDRTLLALRSLWMLISHFMMELNVVLFGCTGFRIQEGRLEESLKATEPLVANSDDLVIRQLVVLLQGIRSHLLLEVYSNIAQLLLDV